MKGNFRSLAIIAASLGCILLAAEATSAARVYTSNDVPKDIPNLATIVSSLTVPDSGTILDVNVQLSIDHTYNDDLNVYLIHDDVTVELFTDVGENGNNFENTVFDDLAGTPITEGSAPFRGRYRPEGSLADFYGLNVQGQWQLRITDDAPADTGELLSWQLIVETCPPPPAPTHPNPADGAEDVPVDTCLSWNHSSSLSLSGHDGPTRVLGAQGRQAVEAPIASLTEEEATFLASNKASQQGEAHISALTQLPVVKLYAAPSGTCRGMCFDGTYLYTADAANHGVFDDHIYKLYPATGSIEHTYHPAPSSFPIGLAWDGMNFYVSGDTDTDIYVTDIFFSQVRTLAAPERWCRDMAYDGTHLWLLTAYTEKIWKLNRFTGEVVDSFDAPGEGHGGLAWDGNHLWLGWGLSVGTIDKISKIDPATGTVLETYDAPGTYTSGLAWDNGYLWCVDWDTDLIYKLAVEPCPTTWDVYFGTDPSALQLIATDLDEPKYCLCGQPCGLQTWTEYYWQVVAKNCDGQTEGAIWSFKTECPVDLNHDTFVDISDFEIFLEKWLDAICPITVP